MKNKILTKVIIVVVCVSVLVSVFAISSSAYTWGNTSAYHNSVEQFTLPTTMLVLENVNSSVTDVPGYFYCPTSDYYGRGERVLASVDSVIVDNNVNFAVLNNVTSSNVYENNGFVQGGDIKFKTLSNSVDFNTIFDLSSFRVEDYWFDTPNSIAESSIYFSTTVSLPNADYFYQVEPQYLNTIISVPVSYYFEYYDYDGVFHTQRFETKYFPDSSNNVMIPYFPEVIYPYLGTDVSSANDPMAPEYVRFYNQIAYLDVLDISIIRDLCEPNFLVPSTETNIDCKGTYISRLLYPNYLGDSFDIVIDNVGETYYDNGYDLGYDTGHSAGYSAGIADGYYDGYDAGNTVGYNTGYGVGYDAGNTDGYNTGYGVGYDAGYDAGVASGVSFNPFDSILSAVSSFIDWEFIPGVSFGIILTIIVGVCLILTFLKFFAGG